MQGQQHEDTTHAMAKAMAEGDIDLPAAYTPDAINAIRLVQMDEMKTPFPPQPPNVPFLPRPPPAAPDHRTWDIYHKSPPPPPPPAPPPTVRHKSGEEWGCAKIPPGPWPHRACADHAPDRKSVGWHVRSPCLSDERVMGRAC